MQLLSKSLLCFMFFTSSIAYCTPPYFSIVNSPTLGQSEVNTLVNDMSFPTPSSYGSLNIPTPNFTVDSLTRSVTVTGGTAQAGIAPDEQSIGNLSGLVQIQNSAPSLLVTDVLAVGEAHYQVYDPTDPSNDDQDCDMLLKIDAVGIFLFADANFYCKIYLNGSLIGRLVRNEEGEVWLEGNGVHIPTYTDAGVIEKVVADPEEIGSPVTETTISVLVDQYVVDIPLGSIVSVETGMSVFTNEYDAEGEGVYYVDLVGGAIY